MGVSAAGGIGQALHLNQGIPTASGACPDILRTVIRVRPALNKNKRSCACRNFTAGALISYNSAQANYQFLWFTSIKRIFQAVTLAASHKQEKDRSIQCNA